MSQKILEQLRLAWPHRVTLRADEVALVLRGSQTHDVVKRVRGKMKDGSYGSGARKVDGVWQLPLTDLAEVIDPTPDTPTIPREKPTVAPTKRKRSRPSIGPYLHFVREARFWADVFAGIQLSDDAQALRKEADDVLRELRERDMRARTERSRDHLLRHLVLPDKPPSEQGPM